MGSGIRTLPDMAVNAGQIATGGILCERRPITTEYVKEKAK